MKHWRTRMNLLWFVGLWVLLSVFCGPLIGGSIHFGMEG